VLANPVGERVFLGSDRLDVLDQLVLVQVFTGSVEPMDLELVFDRESAVGTALLQP